MPISFSKRTDHDDAPNPIARALAAARNRGPVVDLTVSNPTTAGIPYDPDLFVTPRGSEIAARALVYAPDPYGLAIAREAIAEEYAALGAIVSPADIFCAASTSEAYAHVFTTLCDEGDEIITLVPSYPLFSYLARFSSVTLVPSPLVYDGAWHLDRPALRARIGPRTRAILLVHPNNPTGSFVSDAELDALRELGVPLVVDEVFAPYAFAPRARRSIAGDPRGLTFALGGLSKLVGLPQAKLAWTAVSGEPALVAEAKRRLELVSDTFLGASSLVMLRAPELFARGASTRIAIASRTRENLATARATFTGAAHALHVEGGWYVTLRLPRTKPEETWAIELLEKHAIYTHPGAFFDFAEEAYLVLSLLCDPKTFAAACKTVASHVDAHT